MRPPLPHRARAWARRAVLVLMVCLTAQLPALDMADADVGHELNSFFNDMGGAANVNGPTAFKGQSAGYYTGGSLWSRFPQKSVNPINLQLPSIKAGCGGIDAFTGSFSFINSTELVSLLKATANNALGFAFQLAIKSISPQIASTIEELSQKVQQMNQFNMNSCEMAQGLVAGLWGKNQGHDSQVCKAIANSQGWATDWAKSRQNCNEPSEQAKMNTSNKDETIPAGDYNYTWSTLQKGYPSFDKSFKEYLMTLVGTVIYKAPDASGSHPSYQFIGGGDQTIVTALLDGSSGQKIYQCDDAEKCLNPTQVTLAVSDSDALKPRIAKLITSMSDKVKTNAALTPQEIGLLGGTSIPLYKIVTVNAAANLGGLSTADIDNLAEIVATDMLEELIRKFVGLVRDGSAVFQNADEKSLADWRDQLKTTSDVLDKQSGNVTMRIQRMQAVLDRSIFLERTLRNGMSPQMSAALNFSTGLSAQGLH